MSTQNVEIISVTPAQARKWLGYNTNNRKISKRHVAYLVGIINRGEWSLSNDAICFAPDGTLLNGQHRLTALIESGKTLPLLVMQNVTRGTQLAMDTGKKRAAHEQMEIMGIHSSPMKAALVRALINYDNEDGPGTRYEPISNAEIIELAEGDSTLDYAISLCASLGRNIPGARVTSVALGYYLLLHAWPDKLTEFHDKLSLGIDLGVNHPIRRLRTIMLRGDLKMNSRADSRKMLALFLKTFNLWIDCREIEQLAWRTGEDWPTPFTPGSYQRLLAGRERARKGQETRLRKVSG